MSRDIRRQKSFMKSKRVIKAEGKLRRILDANFNRAKEGLRVCEDTCRFFFDAQGATRRYKDIRHELTAAMAELEILDLIHGRDVGTDVGRKSSKTESKRRNIHDIFYANSQRVKESIRVLEEFAKILNPRTAERLKILRYRVYDLEQQVVKYF